MLILLGNCPNLEGKGPTRRAHEPNYTGLPNYHWKEIHHRLEHCLMSLIATA